MSVQPDGVQAAPNNPLPLSIVSLNADSGHAGSSCADSSCGHPSGSGSTGARSSSADVPVALPMPAVPRRASPRTAPLKAVLIYSNDDGFALGTELLRAVVAERVSAAEVDHRVWFHELARGTLAEDYLGHFNRFLARLAAERPDVVAFSAFVWNHDEFVRMGRMVRRHLPGCRIVWGGAQANSVRMADAMLRQNPWLDLVLRGEGEATYPALLADLARGGDGRTIAGVSHRRGQDDRGREDVVHNPPPPDVDLRELPDVFTDDNLPMAGIFRRNPNAVLAYETGRGCRQKCKFCLYAVSKLRVFSMERVERELRWLLKQRVPYIRICDAHFGVSKPRAMETFEIIAAHNDGTVIDVYPDTKHVDLDYVRAMNRAGCRVVSLGIQSSDLDTLGIAKRRFDPQRFAEVARLIRKHHNHALAADVIVGMPGDDYAKVRETVRFAYRSGVQTVHFAPLMAFPGTDFFESAEDYGLEYFDFTPPLAISSSTFSAEQYMKAMLLAHRVESLQQTAPMLLRCLLADPDSDPVDFAESLDLEAAAVQCPDPLDAPLLDRHVAGQPSAQIELLHDGLRWDRARRDQQGADVPAIAAVHDDTRLAGFDPDAVRWFSAPIHRLTRDAELTAADLPRGKFAYLFPQGGAAVYGVQGILAAGLEAASGLEATTATADGAGLTVADWRRRTIELYAAEAAESAVPATPALCDSVLRVLRLAGVVDVAVETADKVAMAG